MPDIKIFILLGLVALASYLKDKVGKSPENTIMGKAGYLNDKNARFMELAIHADGVDSHEVMRGTVVVHDGEVIGKGWSDTLTSDKIQTTHSEFSAIHDALQLYGNSLHGCYLYTTSYPCNQCLRLIQESGISKIYYGIDRQSETAAFKNHADGHLQSAGTIAIPLPIGRKWNSSHDPHSY